MTYSDPWFPESAESVCFIVNILLEQLDHCKASPAPGLLPIFWVAQDKEAILLIDEADTFFRSRENALQNYEISHTNEFLNQMENHNTILICCTNMVDHFDKALLHRFHEKIEFKPMPVEKLRSVFLTCFSDLLSTIPRPANLDQRLRTLPNMTAGDFRSIERRLRLRGSAVPLAYILEQLKPETASRHRVALIGFR